MNNHSLTEKVALEQIADRLIDQRDEPWPSGSEADRLHYWRDKAIKAANDIRAITTLNTEPSELVRLREENERLSRAVCSGVLNDLLTPDENEALLAFIKQLRSSTSGSDQ